MIFFGSLAHGGKNTVNPAVMIPPISHGPGTAAQMPKGPHSEAQTNHAICKLSRKNMLKGDWVCRFFESQGGQKQKGILDLHLLGGFNPSEKYESKWESSLSRGEHLKYLKPPPSVSRQIMIPIPLLIHRKRLPNGSIGPYNLPRFYTVFTISGWWFQPIWKILVELDHFPK